MTNPLATQTVLGLPVDETYKIVTTILPNGKPFEQLFQRVFNEQGKEDWQLVDEKLKAFDEQFKDTTTVPAAWKTPSTEVLTPRNRENDITISQGGITRIDLRRQLILGLGDPKSIIQNKGLDICRLTHFKAHPSTLTLLHMIALKHGGEWTEAAGFIKPVFQDGHQ